MFYVDHLSGWDMIVAIPALQVVLSTISAGTAPVTIQPSGMDRFCRRMWGGNRVTDHKPDITKAANSILARADQLAVRVAELETQFNPVAEFAGPFPKEIPRELPPLRKIDPKIYIMSGSSCIPTYRPSEGRFTQEIIAKMNSEQIS